MNPNAARDPERPEQDPAFHEVMETLRSWPDAPPPDLAPAVLARIRAHRRMPLALAAVLSALLGATLVMTSREPSPAHAPFVSASDIFFATAEAPAGFAIGGAQAPPAVESAPDEDASLKRARAWLLSRQDAGGGWTMGRAGAAANYTVGTTALALLALLGGERDDATRASLARGGAYLVGRQNDEGLFGPAITGSLYNHTLACLALLRLRDAGVSHPDIDRALRDGIALVARSQRPSGRWLRVLMEARERGVADYTSELERGLAWLERTVDAEGRAGYRRCGDHPHGSETLTAAVALCFLEHRADWNPLLIRMIANIRRDVGDAHAPMDLYRTFFQVAALRADPQPDAELPALAARLRAVQEAHGEDAGSWPPLDRWSSAGGRVYSTALALLALTPDPAARS